MARVETVVVPKPEFDFLKAELERLRGEKEQYDLNVVAWIQAEAELERLRGWVDVFQKDALEHGETIERLRDAARQADQMDDEHLLRAEKAERELERLRRALQQVWTSRDHSHARDIARAALEEEA